MCRGVMSHNTFRLHDSTRPGPTRLLPRRSIPPTPPHRPALHTPSATSPGPPATPTRRAALADGSAHCSTPKATIPLCLIISTTPATGTGNTAPPAAAPTPKCSSPPTVNAATSAPSVSTPPNRSVTTAPCSPTAAPMPSPPPRLMASGVGCPRTNAPASPDAPASRPDPVSVASRRTL